MKKKLLFFVAILATVLLQAKAEDIPGIYVTYPDAIYTYKLTSVPKVTYLTEEGVTYAVLTPNEATDYEPIAKMKLADGAQVVITYANYVPTGIDDVNNDRVTIKESNGKKYIQGGKLIIVDKNGNKFDINGRRILDEEL